MTAVYKTTPRSQTYHWKYGEGPHQAYRDYNYSRIRRDERRDERGESWSECGRRLPDDSAGYMWREEEEVGPELRCASPGCAERWSRYERARARAGRARTMEEAGRRDLAVHARGDAGGAAAGGREGVPGLPGQGTPGGVAGGEAGGLPGPQDAGAVPGNMAPVTINVNGVNARLAALGTAVQTMGNAFTLINGHFVGNTTMTVRVPHVPPPPPPCACGQDGDRHWEHTPEECTWKEGVDV